ncbi:P-loop containing nucleoside triphosphate hydrolase protein [Aureobasidium pullulans EXF-150]|uniref:p-loop containing nucleoside triphosphate hydrolase protein n=1 Tax=Aureobasidium pullulans EXF-150 TaxID=1043002 RepID=A0A074XRT9_AURPU|nr:P-loop containing nucleoside triphosphate hydrolase protein [Aureobasidium pullulans EXF-150]KEQ86374.1 P-loop containing nucleoside triphosphate hydrolase protein [Aureobasidium pullulans EXF-150]
MDFLYIGRQIMEALPSGNGTEVSDLPIKLLEAVVPGYSLFATTVQQWLGFDISLVMTCVAFFFIAKRAFDFLWSRSYKTFLDHFSSSVHIDGSDDLYTTVLEWIGGTRPDLSKRSLTARTQYGNQYDSDDESDADGEDADMLAKVAIGDHGYFNFSKTAARIPPRYEPFYGRFWFTTPRGTFQFSKTEYTVRGNDGGERTESALDISCIGLTTAPIKLLIADIKAWSVRKEGSKTVIRIPCSERWNAWMRSSERPSRPLDTVILDPEQKSRILSDMDEYLHPLSPKWYASRGIPYRRGYLFSGPPGTGKTSLSFSLAGIFGLDIHIINLMDPSMSESMLSRLFNNLPKRCIVLFEDIDAAGIKKRKDDSDGDSDSNSDSKSDCNSESEYEKPRKVSHKNGRKSRGRAAVQKRTTTNGAARPVKQSSIALDSDSETDDDATQKPLSLHRFQLPVYPQPRLHPPPTTRMIPSPSSLSLAPSSPPNEPTSKISLSGLLNCIDGVATHEGRILIMTTNHPEKLDPALIRAGRVDMQIAFTNATSSQIKSLFLRMYAVDNLPALSAGTKHLPKIGLMKNFGDIASTGDTEKSLTEAELEVLSTQFAELLPEGRFAPSDVQGYLLLHRKKPREAVEKAAAWRDTKLAEMADKEKSKMVVKKAKKA